MTTGRIIRSVLAASLTLAWLAIASPVAACRCVALGDFDQVATAEHVIVAGTPVARAGDLLTIAVDRWFWGAEPRRMLEVADPATTCGSAPLGQRTLWVATLVEGRPHVSGCRSWSLADPVGQDLLARAEARFGAIGVPVRPVDDPPGDQFVWFAIGGVGVAALVVFGAAVAISARRGRDEARP